MSANYQSSPRFPHGKTKVPDEEQNSSQRVIIPRGIVDPNQTTIIEIPSGMENMGTVVAQKSQIRRSLSPSRRQYYQNSPQEQQSQYSKVNQKEHSQFSKLQARLNNIKRSSESTAQDQSPQLGRANQQYSREIEEAATEESYYETEPKYYTRGHPGESARPEESGYYTGNNYADQSLRKRSSPYRNDQQHNSRLAKCYLQIPEYRTKTNHRSQSPAASPAMEVKKSLRIKRVLDRLDEIELQGLEEDLKNFQTARRKLIFDVSSMKMF